MDKLYVPRAEGQALLEKLDCNRIPIMDDNIADWWRDPFGYKFAMQVHGPDRDYYRVQVDNIPKGLARTREIEVMGKGRPGG